MGRVSESFEVITFFLNVNGGIYKDLNEASILEIYLSCYHDHGECLGMAIGILKKI